MLSWLYWLADAARHRVRRARWPVAQAHGRRGEDLAHRYLRRHGLQIVARNLHLAGGEIDLVAWDSGALVFVEVKTRLSEEFGDPERAVDAAKQIQLQRPARYLARRHGVPWERVRFDVVSVVLGRSPVVEWRKDAFRLKAKL